MQLVDERAVADRRDEQREQRGEQQRRSAACAASPRRRARRTRSRSRACPGTRVRSSRPLPISYVESHHTPIGLVSSRVDRNGRATPPRPAATGAYASSKRNAPSPRARPPANTAASAAASSTMPSTISWIGCVTIASAHPQREHAQSGAELALLGERGQAAQRHQAERERQRLRPHAVLDGVRPAAHAEASDVSVIIKKPVMKPTSSGNFWQRQAGSDGTFTAATGSAYATQFAEPPTLAQIDPPENGGIAGAPPRINPGEPVSSVCNASISRPCFSIYRISRPDSKELQLRTFLTLFGTSVVNVTRFPRLGAG